MTNRADSYGWNAVAPQSCDYLAPKVLAILRGLDRVRSVCDLGCGNGALAERLASEGFVTSGVEYDKEGYELAKARAPGATFFNLALEDDPASIVASQGRVDAVVSTEVIEHLFSPHLLPIFARGLLAPRGYLIISTPYHGYLKNLALSFFDKWDDHHTPLWHGGHIKFFSRRTLTQLLAQHGFEVVDFQGAGRAPYLWKSMVVVARLR